MKLQLILIKQFLIKKKNEIVANGKIVILSQDQFIEIHSAEVIYNTLNHEVKSNRKTFIKDNFENNYNLSSFFYEIKNNILKTENLEFFDKDNNYLETPLAFINTKSGNFYGKDIKLRFDKSLSGNKENDPRLFANQIEDNKEKTILTKGVFTNCKIRDDDCPPWELSARKITHDKKKKRIDYNDAFLKIYDVPVFYFPKFFHPDPTVERQSGFLIPTLSNSKKNNYLKTPYFLAISENRDATFMPKIYNDKRLLLQTEYREVNKNSSHMVDLSYFSKEFYNSKNHFFYEYQKDLNLDRFESDLNVKLQSTSNDNYLRVEDIKSEINNNNSVLTNNVKLNLSSETTDIGIEIKSFEDLNKKESDRFEFIFPQFNFSKRLKNPSKIDGNFLFKSNNQIREYNTNINEKININDLSFTSNQKISPKGFLNNFELLLKNANIDANNSTEYQNSKKSYLSGIFQFNSSFPMIKKNSNYQSILKPKLSLRAAPSNTKNNSYAQTRIDINNLYSLDRVTKPDNVEGGLSLILGNDYLISNIDNSREIFMFNIGTNLRIKENNNLSRNNQINQKNSNLFSKISFNPSEYLNVSYDSSVKNNLSDISYENLTSEFKIKDLSTSFVYTNENSTIDQISYLSNKTEYKINDFNSFSFSTRKNKTKDLTEYYNMMYQYKNDCLAASIKYKKDFYSDAEIEPNESVFFELTIIPFSSVNSPNIY